MQEIEGKKNSCGKKKAIESEENGEALQTEVNVMDCSQQDNDCKKGSETGREGESIREGWKLVCNGFSQWDR